ncbi:hypothetical protein B0H63DRAFT_191795 [Podospora didyma]|uniref:F-box domain-containing protein n=1 Tax=Podospora didyma TaxID=330526 RepID=A0AAE0NQY9_9PEZI|nr:hypothetical protein B0H63DRAFT_191795 [Podospora didyma]
MAGFAAQPDEGYSEDPLNPVSSSALFSLKPREDAVSGLGGSARSADDFPAWLTQHISNLTQSRKTELTMALLNDLPTSVISQIVEQLNPRLYIDFICYLPPEVCLKILGYLDPVSLINVARSCRAWFDLALDRKLWEQLYYMEGWKAKTVEILEWERKMNGDDDPSVPGQLHRVQSEEYGHTHKKRTISSPRDMDGDSDMSMVNPEHPLQEEPEDIAMGDSSIFGDPSTSFGKTGISQQMGDLDMQLAGSSSSSSSKGKGIDKGKAREASPLPDSDNIPAHIKDELLRQMIRAPGLPQSHLWHWDGADQRFKINWKYLYSMRRRLEHNWELGKFTNFQLPHPDHPEEGHGDCIYSLQYNDQFLVSGSRDRKLKIWDMVTRRCLRTLAKHRGSVLCLQFDSDPEEDIIVSGSSDSDVIIWSFSTGKELQILRHAHRESVLNVRFDKRIVVTCSKDKTIKIFNRRPLKYGDLGYQEVDPVPRTVKGYGYTLNVTPDDLPVTPPWTMIGCLEGHSAAVNAVQIHDREVVSASGDRYIKVWDWPTQACTRTFIGHTKGIACVQYDGRRIVSGSSDNEVKIFDRQTGLEVASLRSHSNLVRTVQAGFGDLPYSIEEDAVEAKRVDAEYFQALESGRLDESERPRSTRRHGNAGSRRPEDICAYGAKLPPGGGGGKYGRIISGSYDTSIIIWRRDKEGIWKDQHHLKQEEAAAAAMRERSQPAMAPSTQGIIPLHPTMRAGIIPPSYGVASAGLSTGPPTRPHPASAPPGTAGPSVPPPAPSNPAQDATNIIQCHRIIDQAVQGGQLTFARAIAAYPAILTQRTYVERAIDNQPSPVLRSQLRQAYSAVVIRSQFQQGRLRREAIRNQEANAATQDPAHIAQVQTHAQRLASEAVAAQLAAASAAEAAAAHQAHAQHAPAHGVRLHQVHLPPPTLLPNTTASAGPPPPRPPRPNYPPFLPRLTLAPHLRIVANPARVYKLQYDARRIICCSQTSVIIGWDFCNADAELEEASRFFGPVQ